MKKRVFTGFVFLAVCSLLTGCHMQHEWTEATCTEPRTCAIGNETEGKALGHDWQDATCTEPETCSRCGETVGEALGHDWQDATYSAPKTCSVCGETEGDALTPDFVAHGIDNFIEEDQTYDYVTTCYRDSTKKTTGHLKVSDYRTFSSDESHEGKEGYEWHALHLSIVFDDDNAWNYGMTVGNCYENYYDIESWDASSEYDEETRTSNYTVRIDGQRATCLVHRDNAAFGSWDEGSCTYEEDYYVLTPIGYTGVVLGFRDGGVEWGEDAHIYDIMDENTLFFRIV